MEPRNELSLEKFRIFSRISFENSYFPDTLECLIGPVNERGISMKIDPSLVLSCALNGWLLLRDSW